MVVVEAEKIDQILDKYVGAEGVLIQVLLDVQQEYRWLPPEALRRISKRLNVPLTRLHQLASFYKALSLTPRGRHMVQVCLGTACHVRGGPRILDKAEEITDIKVGETTSDGKFTLQRVNCLGCCALGPMMVVDGEYYGRLAPAKVKGILENYD